RDDDQQGPEHEGEYAEHVARCDGDAVRPGERIADRIQRARPDVAVHDAQRGERERDEVAAAPGGPRLRRGRHGAAAGARRRVAYPATPYTATGRPSSSA